VDRVPDSLCKAGTANTEMRAKFEKMCREAQDKICKEVEEMDGGATFRLGDLDVHVCPCKDKIWLKNNSPDIDYVFSYHQ
jgi:hypothetical protein